MTIRTSRCFNFKPAVLVRRLCKALAKWWPAFRGPIEVPRMSFALEGIEPRLLLSADISYTHSPIDFNPLGDGDLDDNSYLVRIVDVGGGADHLQLVAEDGGVLADGVLANDGINKLTITGSEFLGDRVAIDFSAIAGQDVAHYDIQILMDGKGVVPLIGQDDKITIVGDGGYHLNALDVQAHEDVAVTGKVIADANISIKSSSLDDGGLPVVDGVLFTADSQITVSGAGAELDGADITLLSESTITITTSDASLGSVNIAFAVGMSDAGILITGGVINAGGNLNIEARSIVNSTLSTIPDDAEDDNEDVDAAIASAILDSTVAVSIAGANIDAGGAATIKATNTVVANTTADGTNGDKGGTVGVAVISGDTSASFGGGTLDAASVLLSATSTRTVNTTSNATKGGAADSGGDQESEETLNDPNKDGDSSDKAASSDGDMSFAAAVAVSAVSGDTQARVTGGSVTAAGVVDVKATGTYSVTTVADGSTTTGDGGTGIGAAVAIGYVDVETLATIGGASLDGSTINVHALTPQSKSDVKSTSGVEGSGSDGTGVAGSLAINVTIADTKALVDDDVDLNGSALDVSAIATTDNKVEAKSEVTGDVNTGVGASVAIHVVDHTTRAAIETGADIDGSVDDAPASVALTATSDHGLVTEADGGAEGGTAVAAAVAFVLSTVDTQAQIGGGAELVSGGGVSANAIHTGTVETTATGDAEGSSVAVGAAIGMNLLTHRTKAGTARSIDAHGNVSLVAESTLTATAAGSASAAGGDSALDSINPGSADAQADDQQSTANSAASSKGARQNSDTSSASQSATSGGGAASSESGSGADGVGIAAAIAFNIVSAEVEAQTSGGADIDAGGAVSIRADASLDAKAQTDATAVDFSNGNVSIGAAVSFNVATLTQTARVGSNSTVTGDSVTLRAETSGGNRNDYSATAYAAGGHSNGTVAVGATVALNVVDYTVRAYSADGSSLNATAGGITVSGEHDIGLLAGGVSGSVSADGVAVGGSVAMNLVNVGDDDGDAYDSGSFASIGDGASGGAAATATATGGGIQVKADTLVATLALDLPESINNYDPDPGNEIDDLSIFLSTLAIAAGGSGGSAGVAGSASVNWLTINTEALVDAGGSVGGSSLLVSADDEIEITSVAGSIGIGASGTGVGAGLDLVVINRFTNARVGAGAVVTLGNGASGVEAESDETLIGVSANFGIGGSAAGVAGSASVHVINMATGAGTHAKVAGAVTGGGDLRIDASGDFTDKMIAGSVGAGSNVGVGVANTTLVQTHTVDAGIADGGVVSLSGGGADLVIEATSTESVLGIDAVASVGGTAAVGGSVAVGVLNQHTDAYVGRNATASATGGNVDVLADADTVLTAVAGNVSFGGTAGVGVAVDVGVVIKSTRAHLESGVSSTVGGNLRVVATSSEDITSVVAGMAASGSAAVSANPSIHSLNLATLAHIGDDPHPDYGGMDSSGAGNVSVTGSIEITADDATEIDKVSAGLALSGGVGVGLAANISVVNKRTEAFIGAGAEVDAKGQGSGVTSALGVITPAIAPSSQTTQHAETSSSATTDGSALTVGASADVGAPSVGDAGDADTKAKAKAAAEVERTTSLAATGVSGIAISATNRDDMASYGVAVAIGGAVGVGVSGGVTVINTNTRAYIDDNARVNDPNTAFSGVQSVRIGAGNDFEQVGIVVAAGGGTVGVGAGLAVAVLNATTEAFIDDGAHVRAANVVTVDARSAEDAVFVTIAGAGGFVGVGGTVGVLTVNNTTQATIGQNAIVSAGDTVAVTAHDETKVVAVEGAAAGGFVGVGAAVGVLVISKDTNAVIEAGAAVDAQGAGGGVAGALTGDLTGGDAADGFDKGTATGLLVQATSEEDVLHIVLAGGGGFVGVGGAVGVTVVDSDAKAEIGAAQINQNVLGGDGQDVTVNAGNRLLLTSIVTGAAGGAVGVGAAVDVVVLRNDAGAFIRNGANVRAGDEVEVNGLSIKDLDGVTVAAAGGAVGVSGSVAVWSVGTDVVSGYDADGDGTVEASEKPGEDGGVSADEDAGSQSGEAVNKTRGMWGGYGGGSDADDPNNRSRSEASTAVDGADSRLGQNDLPSQAGLTGKVNAGAALAGTQAIIEGGATVRAGASAAVGGITVNAKADVEVDMFLGQFAGGAVGAGGSVGIVSLQEKVEAVAAGTLRADGAIDVDAHLDSELDFLTIAGNGGAVALGASVVVLTDSSVVLASIGDSAVIEGAGNVTVDARTDRAVTSTNIGVSGGAIAIGASFSFVEISGEVKARVGANAQIAQAAGQSVGSLAVTATSNESGTGNATGLQGGAVAGQLNFAIVNIKPTVLAEIGAGADIDTTGNATVDANTQMVGSSTIVGISIGGGALVGSVATVSIAPTVTAALRGNATVNSANGTARVRAQHNSGGPLSATLAVAGAGGALAVAGAVATTSDTATVRAVAEGGSRLEGGADAEVGASSGTRVEAAGGGVTIGGIGVGASVSDAMIGGSVTAEFLGQQMTAGQTVRVQASTDHTAQATTLTAAGGVFTVTINSSDAEVSNDVTARVGNGANVSGAQAVVVQAGALDSATSETAGTEVIDVGLAAAIGASETDAILNSTVTAEVGTATVTSSGGTITVKATHNEGVDRRAVAIASASGGSLGVAASGADADASVNADVHAKVGGAGGSLNAAGGVVIWAEANNHARAVTNGTGVAGIAGIGVSSSTAVTNGNTEARVVDGSDAGNRTVIAGGGLSLHAEGKDRARAFAEAGGGGIVGSGASADADAITSPNVIAEIGAYTSVNVGGAVQVRAEGAAEADSQAAGISVSGLLSIGSSDSNSYITAHPDHGQRLDIFARIDDAAVVQAGSASVRALFNTADLRNELGALYGSDGDSRSEANVSSGSAATAPDVNGNLTVLTDVNAIIGSGAQVTTTGSIALEADGRSHLSGSSDGFQFGALGAFGAADAIASTNQDVDAVIGDNAQLVAGGSVYLNAYDATYINTYAISAGGGIFASAADADSYGTILSTVNVAFGAGADVSAQGDIVGEAKQTFSGRTYGYAESYSGGGAAVSESYYTVTTPAPGVPTLTASVGANATLYARDAVKLSTLVDGGTIETLGYAYFGGAFGYADSDGRVSLNHDARLTIDGGALVTGEDLVDLRTEFREVYQDSDPDNGDEGLEAIAISVGAGNVAWRFLVTEVARINAADTATVATRDLQVRTLTEAPAFDHVSEDTVNEGGTNAADDERYEGRWTPDRQISFDADVILLSGPVPELTVEASGLISRAINLSVNDGGVTKGQGDTIVNAEFQVNDIANDDPGNALIEANAVSNPFSQPDDMDDGFAEIVATSQVFGNDGTWYARRTFDTVTLINHSAKKMIVNDIRPIDRLGDPDGDVFINVNDRAPAGKDPFNFQIVNQFEPTLVTVTSTSGNAAADIQFNGEIDNPIGDTVVTGGSDILGDGSQLIRTNLATFTAANGSIGTLAPGRMGIAVDLVESNARPEFLDATAGGDIVIDLRGIKRSTSGAPFTLDIGTLDAGDDVNLLLHDALSQLVPVSTGSYALTIDENNNGGSAGGTPGPEDYVQFFRPDVTPSDDFDYYYDFWQNEDAPLGVFGTGAGAIDATYDFEFIRAGRLTNLGDIDLNASTPNGGAKINVVGESNVIGSGEIDILTDGNIVLEETLGDMRVERIESTSGNVTLYALDTSASIIDAPEDIDPDEDDPAADVVGNTINLFADDAIGERPSSPADYLEIDSSHSAFGVLNAEAGNDIFIVETDENPGVNDLNVGLVVSDTDDVTLVTLGGSILDGFDDAAADVVANDIDLLAFGGGIGVASNDLDIDSNEPATPATGRLFADATNDIYLTETAHTLTVLRAWGHAGAVRLSVPDTGSAVDESDEDLILLESGIRHDLSESFSEGRIQAGTSVELRVGDDIEIGDDIGDAITSPTFVLAGTGITARGDWGDADAGHGTTMNLRGHIGLDAASPDPTVLVPTAKTFTRLFGNGDVDRFNFLQTDLDANTSAYGSATVTAGVLQPAAANDGEDSFLVDRLRSMHVDRSGAGDTLTLDGQADTDSFTVVTTGSNGVRRNYVVNVLDTGAKDDIGDELTISAYEGATSPSNKNDVWLLRGMSFIPGETSESPAFVAQLHGDLAESRLSLDNPGGAARAQEVQRINYDIHANGRIAVYGNQGNDFFAVDDTSAIVTVDGGQGDDGFQIGQLFGTQRNALNNLAAGDVFGTLATTRGYLSPGIHAPLVAHGGTGNDTFTVYSNQAELRLEGDDGNDLFVIRAFGLAQTNPDGSIKTNPDGTAVPKIGDLSTGEKMWVRPGGGNDEIQYNVNAPVSIDGGAGFDKVVILGTEFPDDIVITRNGVFGAGLNVRYDNIEVIEVDGLEGDDEFFVLSTPFGVATRVIGGQGSDTINVAGDVVDDIILRQLEGTAGTINHGVTSQYDAGYDGLLVSGIDLNISSGAEGVVIIDEDGGVTDGYSQVREGGGISPDIDSYTVRLAVAPAAGVVVYVTVSAARSPKEEQDGVPLGDTMLISTNGDFQRHITVDGVATDVDKRSVVLKFTSANSPQTIFIKAVDDLRQEGPRTVTINHAVDAAIEAAGNAADQAASLAIFDRVAVRNVEVEILDNDKPGLEIHERDIDDPSKFDRETLVLEDATYGIVDIYDLNLAKTPEPGEVVTVRLTDGGVGAQLRVSSLDARFNDPNAAVFGDETVTFTTADWFIPVRITVSAFDDTTREDPRTSVIRHVVESNQVSGALVFGYDDAFDELLDVEVLDDDTPGVIIKESGGGTLVVKNDPPITADEQDTYTVRLTKSPVEDPNDPSADLDVKVRVDLLTDGQTDIVIGGRIELTEIGGPTFVDLFEGAVTFNAATDTIVRSIEDRGSFLVEGFAVGQKIRIDGASVGGVGTDGVFTIAAVTADTIELVEDLTVTGEDDDEDVILARQTNQGLFDGLVNLLKKVPQSLVDADPDVIQRSDGGSWLDDGFLEGQMIRVIVGGNTQDYKIERIGGSAEGLNDLMRLRAVDNLAPLGYANGVAAHIVRLAATVTFDESDWYQAVTVTVQADLNYELSPDRKNVKEFAVRPHLLSELRGPLSVEGGVTGADRSLVEAVVLPRENDGPFLVIAENLQKPENQQIDVLNVFADSSQEDLVGTVTQNRIHGFNSAGDLQFPEGTAFGEPAIFLGGISFGQLSFSDATGWLTSNLTTIEVVNLMLGAGNDSVLVTGTPQAAPDDTDGKPDQLITPNAPSLHGGITLVQGGGNSWLDPVTKTQIGGDHITVTGGGGANSVLAVYGDSSQDGVWYSGEAATTAGRQFGPKSFDAFPTVPDEDEFWEFPVANRYDYAGRDVIDASALAASGPVGFTAYGGANDDLILGSQGGDHLAGGSGNDEIHGNAGVDHIYGDSGFNIDVLGKRMNVPVAGPDAVKLPLPDLDNGTVTGPYENYLQGYSVMAPPAGTGLAGPQLDTANVNTSLYTNRDRLLKAGNDLLLGDADDDIIFGDYGRITQAEPVLKIRTTEYVKVLTITSEVLDKGGDDVILGGADEDILIGGANTRVASVHGADRIDGGTQDDLIFGDNATLQRRVADANHPLYSNERYRVLNGTSLYANGSSQFNAVSDAVDVNLAKQFNNPSDPTNKANWQAYAITSLDHTAALEAIDGKNFGDDYIAGGAQSDMIFAGLGDDTVQGDGSIGGVAALTPASLGSVTVGWTPSVHTPTAYGAGRAGSGSERFKSELALTASVEAATDGDDYIEGNAGADLIFGNLGQDDIIGGSSNQFSLDLRSERPDGEDLIFGGAGTDTSRGNIGDATQAADGTITPTANGIHGHSRDADVIAGDNANIFRIRGVTIGGVVQLAPQPTLTMPSGGTFSNGQVHSDGYLNFGYDVYADATKASGKANVLGTDDRIIVRAVDLIAADYTPGGTDLVPGSADIGGADEVHGESGDDAIYGMTGNDVLFGDGQDDDLVGGWGADWFSGGTGDDGVIGDDGRVFTSRNSAVNSGTTNGGYGEPLFGVAAFALAADADLKNINGNALNEVIYTPGNVQSSTINVAGQLTKSVNLTPWNLDSSGGLGVYENPVDDAFVPRLANDVIYGGLGNDWLHGGAGDDAISGAEALSLSYIQTYDANGALNGVTRSDWLRPFNSGDVLRFNPDDPTGWHKDPSRRSGEFALYDEYDPRRKIELVIATNDAVNSPLGSAYKGVAGTTGGAFLLNFNARYGTVGVAEGIARAGGTTPDGVPYLATYDDGRDRLFGDLGNDWIVGGTGRDTSYGGFGNDLINDDDFHDTETAGVAAASDNESPDTQPYYEDRAYGGAGRDVLIANTGGDRLIDWVGEFNTFLVPFAPFGMATVSRTLQPQLAEFLYALSRSDGADPTRNADSGSTSAARNGEPFGELGLVRQQDPFFHDQTGAPADPQAGNIPGGKRDVLRSATFDNNKPENLLADSGTWQVSAGVLQVAANSSHSDAVAVYQIGDRLPSYFEVTSRIKTFKPTGGWNANSYVIFDYVSYSDFKYAGIDVSTNKLVIGHRESWGWAIDSQTPFQGKADQWYDVKVAINGTVVTVTVDNKAVSKTYNARIVDGISYGLNWGLVGFGSNNARGAMDNIAVQVLPPQMNIVRSDDFATAALPMFGNEATGAWSVAGGRYAGTAAASAYAVEMIDLSGVTRLASTSALELSVTLNTSSRAGVVFDRYQNGDFKWAALDVQTDQILIGHFTKRAGWVIDKAVAFAPLTAGVDFNLTLFVKDSTVTLTVANLAGSSSALASHAFNAVAVDGGFGLMVKGGTASFDKVTARTDDTQVPQSLVASSAAIASTAQAPSIDEADLRPLVDEALRRWSLSQDAALVDALRAVPVRIADLPGLELGRYQGGTITIDVDAAGHGWFVDATPRSDGEYRLVGDGVRSAVGGAAAVRMDLLSVLVHELGHAAGFGHDHDGVMDDSLTAGTRVAPTVQAWRFVDSREPDIEDSKLALIDWSMADARKRVQPQAPDRNGWQARFVNELGAPAWGSSPNSRIQVHLTKVGGRALH